MTKTQRDRQERLWLLRLAADVASSMRDASETPDLVPASPSQLRTETANTDGWYVEIGRVRTDRGSSLQIWLDRWPTLAGRKLYVCYKGTRVDQIKRVAAAASASLGRALRLTDKAWHYDRALGFCHLNSPLPAHLYGTPIAELYEAPESWAFYGMYLRQSGSFRRRPPKALSRRLRLFLELTVKSVSALADSEWDRDYSAIENRSKVSQHLRRERSTTLARNAKVRDGYTCRVCDLNFEIAYGRLGRGFAEAHHRAPLTRLRAGVKTRVKDLVTVCSNCHRMLHRMSGNPSDIAALRRIVAGRQ